MEQAARGVVVAVVVVGFLEETQMLAIERVAVEEQMSVGFVVEVAEPGVEVCEKPSSLDRRARWAWITERFR